jgi:hypothetical protein
VVQSNNQEEVPVIKTKENSAKDSRNGPLESDIDSPAKIVSIRESINKSQILSICLIQTLMQSVRVGKSFRDYQYFNGDAQKGDSLLADRQRAYRRLKGR